MKIIRILVLLLLAIGTYSVLARRHDPCLMFVAGPTLPVPPYWPESMVSVSSDGNVTNTWDGASGHDLALACGYSACAGTCTITWPQSSCGFPPDSYYVFVGFKCGTNSTIWWMISKPKNAYQVSFGYGWTCPPGCLAHVDPAVVTGSCAQ